MHRFYSLFCIAALCFSLQAYAQSTLPLPRNIAAAYAKGTRADSGKPGENYWQNIADYSLAINFNPTTRKLSGTVDIVYSNNSPDTLKQLVFKLYPNLYKKGAARSRSISPSDEHDGVQIQQFSMNGQTIDNQKLRIAGTNMVVEINPLPPGEKANVALTYHYTLNEGSHNRTGQVAPGAHFVAYFFPRIAVYDDIDGWNMHPYNGSQEFYNDFCNFAVDITVPEHFVVWATGDLKNPLEVLQEKYAKRLQEAEQQDAVVTIIGQDDLKKKRITASNASNHWKFEARNVVDFAFAISDHYMWQSSSLVVDSATQRRTRVDAAYDPQHKDFEEVIHFARQTVAAMSYVFPKWPFPYSHETVFDGLDQMEYPMMVNDNPLEDRAETIELTDHEIFHTMFPFYLGINETKYGWMDEGWATLGEWIITSEIDSSIVDDYGVQPYAFMAGTEADVPIITLSTQQTGAAFYLNSYPKPALGYLYVKEMLGDSLFTQALHYYIEQWNGKHPLPYDFFNAMNSGAGRNMNWFWQRWFMEGGHPDLSIAEVTAQSGIYTITIEALGSKPVPVELTTTYEDGSTAVIKQDVSVWEKGDTRITLDVKADKKVKQFSLGGTYIPDSEPANNVYEVK